MAQIAQTTLPALAPLPPLSRLAFALARTVWTWETRRQARVALASLDAHLLYDIGISAQTAEAEAAKPFWRD